MIPTNIMMVRAGILLTKYAPSGAARIPPRTNPIMMLIWVIPIIVKKVIELANATKNSVRLTDPMV